MILRWFKRRGAASARERTACENAQRAFVAAYPDRAVIAGMTRVFHQDEADDVVQICYDWGGIPPRRSWWLVIADGSCRELSHDEVAAIRPVPLWR